MAASVKQLQANAAIDASLGDWAVAAIAKHYGKICKHEPGVLADRDPEELHQMRVGMRRLRSALHGFAPALKLEGAASERRVGKLARCLGDLRDLDVLGAALRDDYLPSLPPKEQQAARPALRALDRQRQRARQRVQQAIAGKQRQRYEQLKASFAAWLEQPQYQPLAQLPLAPVLPDLLLPVLSELLLHPAWLVGTVLEANRYRSVPDLSDAATIERLLATDGEPLHDLRKTAKRVRYQMELFAPCFGEPYQRALEQVKAIQTVLGDLQDSIVLSDFLTTALGPAWSHRLPTLMAQLQAQRVQKWREWQVLQRQFLDPDTRHALRATVLPQPPALDAERQPEPANAANLNRDASDSA